MKTSSVFAPQSFIVVVVFFTQFFYTFPCYSQKLLQSEMDGISIKPPGPYSSADSAKFWKVPAKENLVLDENLKNVYYSEEFSGSDLVKFDTVHFAYCLKKKLWAFRIHKKWFILSKYDKVSTAESYNDTKNVHLGQKVKVHQGKNVKSYFFLIMKNEQNKKANEFDGYFRLLSPYIFKFCEQLEAKGKRALSL